MCGAFHLHCGCLSLSIYIYCLNPVKRTFGQVTSLHTAVCSQKHLMQVEHWVNVYCLNCFAPVYWKTIITNMNVVGNVSNPQNKISMNSKRIIPLLSNRPVDAQVGHVSPVGLSFNMEEERIVCDS